MINFARAHDDYLDPDRSGCDADPIELLDELIEEVNNLMAAAKKTKPEIYRKILEDIKLKLELILELLGGN